MNTLLVLVALCGLCRADYQCLCNYNVETPVMDSRSPSANTIGYMYEFDCKPTTTIGGNDPKIWGTIAFEKKQGYVHMDQQITKQICPGNPPATDMLPTTVPTTTTSTTKQTTSTIQPSSSTVPTARSVSATKPITASKPTSAPTTTSKQTAQSTTSQSQPKTTVRQTKLTTAYKINTQPSSTQTVKQTTTSPSTVTTQSSTTSSPSTISYSTSTTHSTTTTQSTTTSQPTTTTQSTTTSQPTTTTKSTTTSQPTSTTQPTTTSQPTTTTQPTTTSQPTSTTQPTTTSQPTTTTQPTTTSQPTTTTQPTTTSQPTTTTQSTSTSQPTTTTQSTTTSQPTTTTKSTTTSQPTTTTQYTTTRLPQTTRSTTMASVMIGNTALCPSSVVQYAQQDNEILTQSGDSCYTVVPHRVSWSHAELVCNNRGGHLFHITDSGQNLFIYILLNTHFNHSVWMGLHDHRQEEHFEWTSGNAVSYTNWIPGRKDYFDHNIEDCAVFYPYKDHGKWDDVRCGGDTPFWELLLEKHYFICQFPASNAPTQPPLVQSGNFNLCPQSARDGLRSGGGHLAQYDQRCYLRVPTRETWDYANRDCEGRGGHLLHIGSSQEEAFIQRFLVTVDSQHAVWIGLHDQGHEETFTWTSGEQLTYTNWVSGRKSNSYQHGIEDCVLLVPYKQGQWDDVPCAHYYTQSIFGYQHHVEMHPYICEYHTVQSGSGGPVYVGK